MTGTSLEQLGDFFSEESITTAHRAEDIPDMPESILSSKFFESFVDPPNKCLKSSCSATCSVERDEEIFTIICDVDEDHTVTLPVCERTYYRLNFEPILEEISTHIDQTLVEDSFENHLPRYVSGTTEEGVQIALLADPVETRMTVASIYMDALQHDIPTLMVVPVPQVKAFLEMQSLFATGSLVYTVPFTIFSKSEEYVRKPVETMLDIQAIEQTFLYERVQEQPNPLVSRVNSNPRYALSELNHMRLLRKNKELPRSSGTRFEKVSEVSFSHLFPTYPHSGGEDERGSDLPDLVFYIPDLDKEDDQYESILGIVDSKSGDEAGFGREEAKGKHDEYLERANRANVNADWRAHVFLILEFDGQQDLEFHEKMSEFYGPHEYMLIITADALALLLAAYLAHTVSNELQLIYGDFRKAIYPLFHPPRFREQELGRNARTVGKNQEKYRDAYLQKEDLLVVHRGVVERQLERCLESPKNIENLFEQYFEPLPTV